MPPSDWSVVWLGVGAVSLALMALLQVGAVIALLKVVAEAQKTIKGVQAQVAPLVDRGQALIASAGDVVHQAQGVVHQAKGVVSNLAVQAKRVEGAVDVASNAASSLQHGVRRVTGQATGLLSGAQAFWSVLRGRSRNRDDYDDWRAG